jgi:hypothetical protein
MKALLNPWVLLALVVLLGATAATSYVHGVNHEKGRAAAEEVKLLAVEDRAAKGAAKIISKLKVTTNYYQQELDHELQENPPGPGCVLSPDGLRYLNAIIEGRPLPTGDRELPAAEPAR